MSENDKLREAATRALGCLKIHYDCGLTGALRIETVAAMGDLREALAASKPEPQSVAGYVNPIEWRDHESERVVKVTRHPQPQYGYTQPVAASRPEPQAQAAEPESEEREFWINVCEGLDNAKRRPSYEHLMLAYREECRKFRAETLRASQLAEAIAKKDAALDACVEAGEICSLAMDDWLNTYAEELCNQERVKAAKERIEISGGTLAYITDVRTNLDAAITKAQEARK